MSSDIPIPSWVISGDVDDYRARKQGYKSDYDMHHSQAIRHYMDTRDYSKLTEFYARFHPNMGKPDAFGVPRRY